MFSLLLIVLLASPAVAGAGELPEEPYRSLDEQHAALAADHPGFGGWYLDDKGNLTVRFKSSRSSEAKAFAETVALEQARKLARLAGKSSRQAQTKLEEADYDFAELYSWRLALLEALNLPSVHSLQIDERRNRIVLGLLEGSKQHAARAFVARQGIPAEAVLIEVHPRVTLIQTLRDYEEYRRGGFQFEWADTSLTFEGKPLITKCSIGFIGRRQGVRGMVTASHCSPNRTRVDGTVYHHPNMKANGFATETVDPAPTAMPGCPAERICRRADALFADYHPLVAGGDFSIARTTSRGVSSGSIVIGTTFSSFSIAGEADAVADGQLLNKMGRSTGWTYGPVDQTCVDFEVPSENLFQADHILLCQNRFGAGSDKGDSGGPAFASVPATGSVILHGIVWGGDSSGTWYSPMANVEADLGPIQSVSSGGVAPSARFDYEVVTGGGNWGGWSNIELDASDSYDPDGGSIVLFSWKKDGYGPYNSTSPTYTFPVQSGGYFIELTVTDDEGQTSTRAKSVNVY